MNTQLSTADYSNIAKMILVNVPDERKTFDVEFATDMYTVFVEVDYDVEYSEVVGGSYEGYDFERLSEISYERLNVLCAEAYDKDGDITNIEISTSTIEKLLN